MNCNAAGIALIKSFESCRLTAYLDLRGIPTIGYGQTGPDIQPGMRITQDEADQMLEDSLAEFEDGVTNLVSVPINENQFSALVCFAYNVGLGALSHSTLLRDLNSGNVSAAADQFLRWSTAGGVQIAGLLRRREAERDLFLS